MTQTTLPPANPPDSRAETKPIHWAIASALLVMHALAAWRLRPPTLTPQSNDDGLYFLLGRALRHFHYVDAHVVGSPAQAQYPPFYPALLAIFGAVFGDSVTVAHLTTVLCSTVALLLLFDIGRRLLGPVPALGLLAALVLNSQFLTYASHLVSEQPYLMASVAAIWSLVVLPDSSRRLWIAGGFSLVAALTRSVGIALVVAVGILWLSERRYRAVAIYAAFSALTVGAWLLWTVRAPEQFSERSYAAAVVRSITTQHGIFSILAARIARFVEVVLVRSPLAGLNVPSIPGTNVDNLAWLLAVYVLGGAGFVVLWRRARIIPLYFAVFLLVLCIYPFKLTRFYMPVLPLLLLAMLAGLSSLGRRWAAPALLAATLAIPLAVFANTARQAKTALADLSTCRQNSTPDFAACFPPEGRAFLTVARYAADNLPPAAAVLTIKEAPFFYYTGHKVMHPQLPLVEAHGRVLEFLADRQVGYVLLSGYPGGAMIADELLPQCLRLELLMQAEPITYLLRLREPEDQAASEGSTQACAAIKRAIQMRPEAIRP